MMVNWVKVNTPQHDDENQYAPRGDLRELPVAARQCEPVRGIPFGVAFLKP